MYLYLLQLTDDEHFKIGISSEWYRMRKVHHAFNINFEKSLSYWGKESEIRKIESEIKRETTKAKNPQFYSMNGGTEIRNINCLKIVFGILKKHGIKMKAISDKNIKKILEPKKQRTISAKTEINIKNPPSVFKLKKA